MDDCTWGAEGYDADHGLASSNHTAMHKSNHEGFWAICQEPGGMGPLLQSYLLEFVRHCIL